VDGISRSSGHWIRPDRGLTGWDVDQDSGCVGRTTLLKVIPTSVATAHAVRTGGLGNTIPRRPRYSCPQTRQRCSTGKHFTTTATPFATPRKYTTRPQAQSLPLHQIRVRPPRALSSTSDSGAEPTTVLSCLMIHADIS